jgi:hypothetical protein
MELRVCVGEFILIKCLSDYLTRLLLSLVRLYSSLEARSCFTPLAES